jgi:hypothetical protein
MNSSGILRVEITRSRAIWPILYIWGAWNVNDAWTSLRARFSYEIVP